MTVPSEANAISREFQILIKRETQRDKIIKTAPLLVLLAMILYFSLTTPGFFTMDDFLTIITQLAVPLIIALGITFVVLVGSIDLSVDGVMGLSSAIVSLLVLNGKTSLSLGIAAIPIVMGVGALCGMITGLLCVKGKIPSFMVTFGMNSIAIGLAMISYDAIPPIIEDPLIQGLSRNTIGGLPIYVYIAAAVFAVAYLIQEKTAFGKHMFAVGENEEFCRVSGVNVTRVRVLVFIWAGMLVGLAGVVGTSQIGRGDVAVGTGQLFKALSAVVLGGTALSGGKGGVLNTLLGTLIITVLNNGLILQGVNPYFKDAIIGTVLIAAVIFSLTRNPKQVTK